MGIITNFIERRGTQQTLSLKDPALIELFGGRPSIAGPTVNEQTALNCAAWYACTRVLAETLASLPNLLYRRLRPRGKERALDHELYPVLHDGPNPELTSFEFRETLQAHLCNWGNAYAEIVRDNSGAVRELWPMTPNRVKVERDPETKKLFYEIDLPDGGKTILPRARVHHLRGLGYEGILGYNLVKMHKEAVGLALGTEEFAGRFFSNSANPSGVLETPNALSDKAYERLKRAREQTMSGLSNAHRLTLLEEGTKWHQVGIDPEKSQLLETRKDLVIVICRIHRIPPHMIASLDRATFSNIEEQAIEFVAYTMLPWIRRWEQAQTRDLLLESERREFFTEFLLEGLLRGKATERFSAYAAARQWGWLSANDIRELENLNPIAGGDTYLSPSNMVPASKLAAGPEEEMERALEEIKTRLSTFHAAIAQLQLLQKANGHPAPVQG